MWMKWLPWRYVLKHVARSQGFADPLSILAQFSRFSQPSEVLAPGELLRHGMIFHTRGLVNSQAIQHNLDWVWPYWVEKQFNPESSSFIPRAFSLTHINLTHRNWTAVGIPDCRQMPIVDPAGLVTPIFDGWSIDGWVIAEDGRKLLPSRIDAIEQKPILNNLLAVETKSHNENLSLTSHATLVEESGLPVCRIHFKAKADARAWLVISVRPYNPEGVSFIHHLGTLSNLSGWKINREYRVEMTQAFERHAVSHYREGDVYHDLLRQSGRDSVSCEVGMASGAALYALTPGKERSIEALVPLKKDRSAKSIAGAPLRTSHWPDALEGHAELKTPDKHLDFLYNAALRTIIMHTPNTIYAGPYTYKRFWFRDAAFIIHALLCTGLSRRAEPIIDKFPSRQTAFGYFESQNGEWDSNGQTLWIKRRFIELTGKKPKASWKNPVHSAGRWIEKKILPDNTGLPHEGLLPAGFSAEHLGPNDFYFWDDFWSVAGLRAAAFFERLYDNPGNATRFEERAQKLEASIDRSLEKVARQSGRPGMPSSPYRRLDSASVGSLAAGYPLQLWRPDDPRLLDTANFLYNFCRVNGAFFHDMTHSGINPYLTLHIAQVYMRAGDRRGFELMNAIASMASPTGQWPEAIHPHTGGGCMGDGQHAWAAAEWILMVRNMFVREEPAEDTLVLCAGIPREWMKPEEEIRFGPAPTNYGPVTITIHPEDNAARIRWDAQWYAEAPPISIRIPWLEALHIDDERKEVRLSWE